MTNMPYSIERITSLKEEVERWKKQATEYRDFLDATIAAQSPEAVAFVEAAKNHCSIANDDEILRNDVAAWYDRSHDEMMRAYAAMIAAEEKGKDGRD